MKRKELLALSRYLTDLGFENITKTYGNIAWLFCHSEEWLVQAILAEYLNIDNLITITELPKGKEE